MESVPSPGFGTLLRRYRVAVGLSQEELAERAGLSARTVGDLERRVSHAPRKDTVELLAQALDLGVPERAALAEAVGDLDILRHVFTSLASVSGARGELEQGRRYAERALEVAEQRGDAAQVVFATVALATKYFFVGDWAQARRHLERALDLGRAIGAPRVVAPPLVLLGWLCLAEGAWDDASRYLEEGRSAAECSGDVWLLLVANALLAERELLEGRPDAALARLTPLLDHPGTAALKRTPLLPLVAWVHLERGEDAAAAEAVARGIEHAQAQHHRLALVDALRVQAMVATRQGCWAKAKQALEEGLALARSMPYPYAEARLLHVSSALHAQKGEPEPACERLEAALAIFRRLGARKDAERVEQALAMDVEGSVF
jgi:transcriptional regulator with XRE-family HTH domain